jgi:4a-hydroxytetrahydrobiopterin dehydratase
MEFVHAFNGQCDTRSMRTFPLVGGLREAHDSRAHARQSDHRHRVVADRWRAAHNGAAIHPRHQEDHVMPAKKLSDAEIQVLLPKLPGWKIVAGKLHQEYKCKDFVAAFGNMTRVALVAEAMNHHPEWCNVWNKVVIDLTTHSVKGISDYDFVLAEKIDDIFVPVRAPLAGT